MTNPIISPPRRFNNPYRDMPIRDLLAEREAWLWDLADIDANPDAWDFAPETRSFVVMRLGDIKAEVKRRDALRSQQFAPRWPESPKDRRAEWDEIKRRTDLVRLIETYGPARFERAGGRLICRCPFPDHDDSTPSFTVDPDKQLWHCFGCKRGGDVFSFAMFVFNLDGFTAAADVLGAMCGVDRDALYMPTPHGPARVR